MAQKLKSQTKCSTKPKHMAKRAILYKKDGHIQHGIYQFLAFKCFIRCYNKHLLFFICSLKLNSLFGIDTCVKGLDHITVCESSHITFFPIILPIYKIQISNSLRFVLLVTKIPGCQLFRLIIFYYNTFFIPLYLESLYREEKADLTNVPVSSLFQCIISSTLSHV